MWQWTTLPVKICFLQVEIVSGLFRGRTLAIKRRNLVWPDASAQHQVSFITVVGLCYYCSRSNSLL